MKSGKAQKSIQSRTTKIVPQDWLIFRSDKIKIISIPIETIPKRLVTTTVIGSLELTSARKISARMKFRALEFPDFILCK